jgi:hypothetical protein
MQKSISPQGSLSQGGIALTIVGSGFGSNPSNVRVLLNGVDGCLVDQTVPFSASTLSCRLPGLIPNLYSVRVVRYQVPSSNTLDLRYYDQPVLTEIMPRGGVTGTTVTLRGANFGLVASDLRVIFGNAITGIVNCSIVANSLISIGVQSELACYVGSYPSNIMGFLDVSLEILGARFESSLRFDIVNPLPNITSLQPSRGVIGTQIVVSGSGFGTDESALNVRVGSGLVEDCLIVTNTINLAGTQFSCRLPSSSFFNAAGLVPIVVFRRGLENPNASPVFFEFINQAFPPVVSGINPPGGPRSGTLLTISGTNFAELSTVSIGAYNCPVERVSISEIVCNSSVPEVVSPGTYLDVTVTSFMLTDQPPHKKFIVDVTFPPFVEEISPIGGRADDILTLYGNGFAAVEDVSVLVGVFECLVDAGSVTFGGARQSMTCRLPENVAGKKPVLLTSAGVPARPELPTFYYPYTPLIDSLSALGGLLGVSSLVVKARNIPQASAEVLNAYQLQIVFTSTMDLTCRASCQPSLGAFDASGLAELICEEIPVMICRESIGEGVIPRPDFYGPTDLHVEVLGLQSYNTFRFYYARAMPVITNISPRGVVPGSFLSIVGTDFGFEQAPETTKVFLGGSACPVVESVLTPSFILCEVPLSITDSRLRVEVVAYGSLIGLLNITDGNGGGGGGGGGGGNNTDYFLPVVTTPPIVAEISPSIATMGQLLTLTGQNFGFTAEDRSFLYIKSRLSERVSPDTLLTCEIILPSSSASEVVCMISLERNASMPSIARRATDSDIKIGFNEVFLSLSLYGVEGEYSDEYFTYYDEIFFIAMDSPVAIAFLIINSLLALIVFVSMALYFIHRSEKLYKPQSPVFMQVIAVAMLLALCAPFLFANKPTDGICAARLWLLSIGFTLSYGVLFAKSWRINAIFLNKNLKRLVISDLDLFYRLLALLIVDVILLSYFTANMPAPALAVSEPLSVVYMKCELTSPDGAFPVALVVLVLVKMCALFYGMYLAYQNRNVAQLFNESKHVAFCIYVFFVLLVFVIPTATSQQSNPVIFFVIIAMACIIVVLSFWVSLFMPRIYYEFRGKEETHDLDVTMMRKSNSPTPSPYDSYDSTANLFVDKSHIPMSSTGQKLEWD